MGLTIHYELRLPPDTSHGDALERLKRLRDAAAAAGLAEVSPVVDLTLSGDDFGNDDNSVIRACVYFFAQLLVDPMRPYEPGAPRYDGDPSSAMGFRVDPGEGAETATFALMRRRQVGRFEEEWYWWCACKTHYACNVSDEHFVKVHCGMVAVLDAAIELGFIVDVFDETGYWEERSREHLVAQVSRSNHLIARLAGAISDAGHEVQAPIFKNRRFEHLEMEE